MMMQNLETAHTTPLISKIGQRRKEQVFVTTRQRIKKSETRLHRFVYSLLYMLYVICYYIEYNKVYNIIIIEVLVRTYVLCLLLL